MTFVTKTSTRRALRRALLGDPAVEIHPHCHIGDIRTIGEINLVLHLLHVNTKRRVLLGIG